MPVRYVVRRLLLLIPVLFVMSIIVFSIIRFAPGDPALMLISFEEYSPERVEQVRHQLGLDQPVSVQYWLWLKRVAVGDLGKSLFTHDQVSDLIASRFRVTALLTFGTLLVSVLISVPLGVISAVRKDSWVDNVSRVVSMIGVSMPVFWLGLLLLIAFALKLRWLPPGGDVRRFGWPAVILPWITLGTSSAALLTRMLRTEMIEVLQQEYIRAAHAKGLAPKAVNYTHALKNAMLPFITVVGMQVGNALGGAVLTETIFDMSGLGRLLVDSLTRRDYPVIQGAILVITVIFVVTNLIVDVAYGFFDPRVKYD